MIHITNELKEKLLAVQSAGEAAALVKAAGQEITEEETARLWDEIIRRREQADKELSLDELDAVSGGTKRQRDDADRDWLTDGCASTVEPNSWCWSNDSCVEWEVTYNHEPLKDCPRCSGYMCYDVYRPEPLLYAETYYCKSCGYRVNTVFPDWEY